jgi:hypothetical protein
MTWAAREVRPALTNRVVRATLPLESEDIRPGCTQYVTARPQVPFRLLEVWTYSPGPHLLVSDIRVGNMSLLASSGSVPAEAWDIVAVTRAVEIAMKAGWIPATPDTPHPLYNRLKITPETASPGVNIMMLLWNPTTEPLPFRASLHGLALDNGGGGYGSTVIHDEYDVNGQSKARFDDLVPGDSLRASPTEPAPAPTPPPASAPTAFDVPCRTCGAALGQACIGMGRGKTHPARGLKPGECSACPRVYWARGLQSKCNFCGKERP